MRAGRATVHTVCELVFGGMIWTYDIERFKQMEGAGQNEELKIRVTYKKN